MLVASTFTQIFQKCIYNQLINYIEKHKIIFQFQYDKLNVWRTRKKSEPQMGFEPTTLRDLVGCSNHWATGDSMVSKDFFRVLQTFNLSCVCCFIFNSNMGLEKDIQLLKL